MLQSMKALALALLLALVPVGGASAVSWGPSRTTYTNLNPAPSATFNSITDNAAVGNELMFVRVAEYQSGDKLKTDLELEAGKKYVVAIYYHNDASSSTNYVLNSAGQVIGAGAGIAKNVRVMSSFPTSLKAGETKEIIGKIVSSNTVPEAVWAGAGVTAKEDMTIAYVADSAALYNQGAVNKTKLARYLFTNEGVFIGHDKIDGTIPGCDAYSGQVMYILQTTAVNKPAPEPDPEPEPEPEPEPDPEPDPEPEPEPEPSPDPFPEPEPDPVTPSELPTTGPVEVILALVIVGAIVAGVVYWWRGHNAVKKTSRRAKGRK